MKNLLTKACAEADKPAPGVLASLVGVLRRLAAHDPYIARMHETGVLKRLMRTVEAKRE